MSSTKDTLLASAYVVRDETNTGANTAARIGQLFIDIINAMGEESGSGDSGGGQGGSEYVLTKEAVERVLTGLITSHTHPLPQAAELQNLLKEYFAAKEHTHLAKDIADLSAYLAGTLAGYLRKDQDDETTHTLTVKNLVARNTVGSDNFVTGAPLSGSGWQVNQHGDIEAESIKVRGFMEVPEIRFNRASIIAGTNIQSPCAGIIKSVQPIDDAHGIAWLELGDDDIVGSIQEGDLCWGYWHDITTKSNNATADYDSHDGIINYSGFATVYFQIKDVLPIKGMETDANGNPYPNNSSAFLYELKPGTTLHPYPQMHFGGRGNNALNDDGTPRYPDRQGFTIATPNYLAVYQLVGSWEWNNVKHIVYVRGLLDGFEAKANKQPGTWYQEYGTIEGNVYFCGYQEQVKATGRFIYITQSSNGIIDPDETETIRIEVRDNYFRNVTKDVTVRINGTIRKPAEGSDAIILKYSYDQLPDEVTRFLIMVDYTIIDNGETLQRSIEETFTIRKMPPKVLTLDIITNDTLIQEGENKRFGFRLTSNTGYDRTREVSHWRIERTSSDAASDAVWNAGAKAQAFAQQHGVEEAEIYILWSNDEHNDLDPDPAQNVTYFNVYATIGQEDVMATIEY